MNKLNHLGVIMDGNRRWARKQNLPTIEGHTKGAWNLFYLCDWCIEAGIKEVTVFVFSTYNWNRTSDEINGLFNLVEEIFQEKTTDCVNKGIKINILGEKTKLGDSLIRVLDDFEKKTSKCDKILLNIAINYGGKEEIIRAVNKILHLKSTNAPMEITMDDFSRYLYCPDDIDLVIRTGGYQRLSNFMTWQTACSEFFFTPTLWPDFSKMDFYEALDYYSIVKINNGK